MKKESLSEALKSIETEQNAVSGIHGWFDEKSFSTAVDIIKSAQRIMTSGCGNSGIACKKLAHTLCCIEINAAFMPPSEAVHGGIGGLKKGDCFIMLSRGGKTGELLPIADICCTKGIKIILFTENVLSPLAGKADIVIPFKVERESDKYNYMATTSIIIPLIIFDALIAALIEETDYKRQQFTLIHPGGAVGEMLKIEEDNK